MEGISIYISNASKEALSQTTSELVCSGLGQLMTIAGIPGAILARPLVQGTVIGIMNTLYDDFNNRVLSKMESSKLEQFFKVAIETFFELTNEDEEYFYSSRIDDSQLLYAYEVAEDAILTAIRQSERTKIDILGRYYGKQLYEGNTNWQDMHQILEMAARLTLRQLVMIRLISESFHDLNPQARIGNSSACVEINRLLDYGVWAMGGALLYTDNSISYPLYGFSATKFSHRLCSLLMLDTLSTDEIKRSIESLELFI